MTCEAGFAKQLLCVLFISLLALPGPEVWAYAAIPIRAGAGTYPEAPDAPPVQGGGSVPAGTEAKASLPCEDPDFEIRTVKEMLRSPEADKWGDITIAQPKIWQFERVSALLDGLLRDVEGVSLADLTQLDPNQQNAAALKFVQSALEVGVQYDQASAVNAANTLRNFNALQSSQLQQLDQYNNYIQTLTGERNRLAAQNAAATNEVNTLQALKAAGPLTDAQNKQLEEASSRQSSTQSSLASVNSLISGAGAPPTLTAPPTVTGTSVQAPASGSSMSSPLSGFADVLKNLPQGVQNNLSTALQSPSYPASRRLDNFVTLLYERLAREISVLQDDLTRDPNNAAFLLQFDVGLYPSNKSKDHVARVEFKLDCPGCKVYSLYPGQSAYNLANYSGSSKRSSFWGNILTLIGFGASASYRRQTDMLSGSLVQSVYTSGFQSGVLIGPGDLTNKPVNANAAGQSFGWYYGPAPFEQLVSPGIRSTFALITVPRKLIERTGDKFGNTNACLPFHIDAGWASRNDPMAQDKHISPAGEVAKKGAFPFYIPFRERLRKEGAATAEEGSSYRPSVLTAKTSVKLPAAIDDFARMANRERDKLHVLRMEYNTVFAEPDAKMGSSSVQTTIQTSTQSTNQTTGQTTTATQTTGTTVVAGAGAPNSATNGASALADPLVCAKWKCAAVVIKLDRPIDPNMVVTVRGEPLMRVRDWRGRATSVLPPAQSGTDLSGTAATAGSLALNQLRPTRSLLESDQFAPNTWFALNSYEMLLNISENVATNQEFPVIQLADPSGAVVIPYDLRRTYTELIINGFRLRPQTGRSIQREVALQNWKENDPGARVLPVDQDAPISSGPYAFSTFVPLFSPARSGRRFWSQVGETGEDLLIGFLPQSRAENDTEKPAQYGWVETATQVILEDVKEDFAWSLSCDVQGELLVCHIPREEISLVYSNFLQACPDQTTCPGLEMDRQPLLHSLQEKGNPVQPLPEAASGRPPSSTVLVHDAMPSLVQDSGYIPNGLEQIIQPKAIVLSRARNAVPGSASAARESLATSSEAAGDDKTRSQAEQGSANKLRALLRDKGDLGSFHRAFVSTMQLWVQQSDGAGENVFYSPEPIRIPFLPLSDDYWNETSFKPWQIDFANADSVTLGECNYLPDNSQNDIYVNLLGVRSWQQWLELTCGYQATRAGWVRVETESNMVTGSGSNDCNNDGRRKVEPAAGSKSNSCGRLTLPTAALANDPIVFLMEFPPHPGSAAVQPRNNTQPIKPASHDSETQPGQGPNSQSHAGDTGRESIASKLVRTTVAIPRIRIGPDFKQPHIYPHYNRRSGDEKTPLELAGWQVVIPVEHSTCADTLDLPQELTTQTPKDSGSSGKLAVQWLNGNTPLALCTSFAGKTDAQRFIGDDPQAPCPEKDDKDCPARRAWQQADAAGRVRLKLDIPLAAMIDFPDRVDVIRTTQDKTQWPIGTLPNLKRLLLPSRLSVVALGPTQFVLKGENASVISAVGMQNSDGTMTTVQAVSGVDFALVTFSSPNSSESSGTGSDTGGTGGSGTSTQITVDTTKDNAGHVKLTTQSNSLPSKPTATAGKSSATETTGEKSSSSKLTPGSYAVVAFMNVASPADPALVKKSADAAANQTTAEKQAAAAQKAAQSAPGDKAKQAEATKLKTVAAKTATDAKAAAAAAKPTPIYVPLNVTDEKGNALVFTIPDSKKQTPAAPTSQTATTCSVPCVISPCTVACPAAPSPVAAPKSQ